MNGYLLIALFFSFSAAALANACSGDYGRLNSQSQYWRIGNGAGSESYWRIGNGPGSESFWRIGNGPGSESYWRIGNGPGSESYWRIGNGPGSQTYQRIGSGPALMAIPHKGLSFLFDTNGELKAVLGFTPH